jgi:hypothetical protein
MADASTTFVAFNDMSTQVWLSLLTSASSEVVNLP